MRPQDRDVTRDSTAAACRVFHLHGVVDAKLIHDRCPVMTAHALVEVQSTCRAAGMVVVLVRGRCDVTAGLGGLSHWPMMIASRR